MSDSRSKKINLSATRALFLSCFTALLILEVGLAFLAFRYNSIQNGILADQAVLLRAREFLNDALRDAQAAWKSASDPDSARAQEFHPKPESAISATETVEMLKLLKRPALIFPSSDLDRLDDTVTNNGKLLAATPPFSADLKTLREKTDNGLSGFIAAIDIRLFASMQEFRREVEFLEMVGWGLIPLLILSTAAFGVLLLSKVMELLTHLKKQIRKLTENIITLQNELRATQKHETHESVISQETQPPPHSGAEDIGTQTP